MSATVFLLGGELWRRFAIICVLALGAFVAAAVGNISQKKKIYIMINHLPQIKTYYTEQKGNVTWACVRCTKVGGVDPSSHPVDARATVRVACGLGFVLFMNFKVSV